MDGQDSGSYPTEEEQLHLHTLQQAQAAAQQPADALQAEPEGAAQEVGAQHAVPAGSDWEVMSPPGPSRSSTPQPHSEPESSPSKDALSSPVVVEADSASEQHQEGSQPSRPGSESSLVGGHWQLAGESDHSDQESAFSDLESELDRASSPAPSQTLAALQATSHQHGLLAGVLPLQGKLGSPASSSRASGSNAAEIVALLEPEAGQDLLEPAALLPAAAKQADQASDSGSDSEADSSEYDEEAATAGPKGRADSHGLAASAAAALRSAWVWLQDLVSGMQAGMPAPVRQATVHMAAAARRLDRTVVLGTGIAVLGGLLAAAIARNQRLSHALRDKDRDMYQLAMKVFNLQQTLQSSRNIPIVRHTSSTCSFSFAGGGV